jgi:hypothetical protein
MLARIRRTLGCLHSGHRDSNNTQYLHSLFHESTKGIETRSDMVHVFGAEHAQEALTIPHADACLWIWCRTVCISGFEKNVAGNIR